MNFLALGQRAAIECGASGTTLTTMNNQTGGALRIVQWIQQAWAELQTEHDDWGWMRSSNLLGAGASFATVSGTAFYPLGSGLGNSGVLASAFTKWDRDSFRNYSTATGTNNEIFMEHIDFDVWRDRYMLGANRNVKTRPYVVAIGPNQEVCVGPPSDGTYTVTADYFVAPTQMAADADLPTGLPAQFHMLIVYKAMQYYGQFEAAPEVIQRGVSGWNMLLPQLDAIWMPQIAFAGALA